MRHSAARFTAALRTVAVEDLRERDCGGNACMEDWCPTCVFEARRAVRKVANAAPCGGCGFPAWRCDCPADYASDGRV